MNPSPQLFALLWVPGLFIVALFVGGLLVEVGERAAGRRTRRQRREARAARARRRIDRATVARLGEQVTR